MRDTQADRVREFLQGTGSDPSEWPSDLRVQQVPKCLEGE